MRHGLGQVPRPRGAPGDSFPREPPMRRRHALIFLIVAGFAGPRGTEARAVEPPAYEVYAVRYATMPGFPVGALVEGADRGQEARHRDDRLGAERPRRQDGPGQRRLLPAAVPPEERRRLHPAGQGPRAAGDQAGAGHRHRRDPHALGPRRRRRPVPEGAGLDPEGRVRLLHRRGLAARRQSRGRRTRTMSSRDGEAQHPGTRLASSMATRRKSSRE